MTGLVTGLSTFIHMFPNIVLSTKHKFSYEKVGLWQHNFSVQMFW